MSNEVEIRVVTKDDSKKGLQSAERGIKGLGDTAERAESKTRRLGGGLDHVSKRASGLESGMGGLADGISGVSTIMEQGTKAPADLALAFADIGSSASNAAIPAVKGLGKGMAGLKGVLKGTGSLLSGDIIGGLARTGKGAGNAGTAIKGLTSKLGGLAPTIAKGGVIAVGLAAVGFGLKTLFDSARAGRPNIEALSDSLVTFSRTGRLAGEGARVLGADFEKLDQAYRTLFDPAALARAQDAANAIDTVNTNTITFSQVNQDAAQSLNDMEEQAGAFDKAIAGIAESNPDAAFRAVRDAAAELRIPIDKLVSERMPAYSAAVAAAKDAAALAGEQTGRYGESLNLLADAAERARSAHERYTNQIHGVLDPVLAAIDSSHSYEDAIAREAAAQADLTAKKASGTATSAELDAAERALRDAHLGVTSAALSDRDAQDALRRAVASGEITAGELSGALQQLEADGYGSSASAAFLRAEIKKLKSKNVDLTVTTTGLGGLGSARDLLNSINSKRVDLTVNYRTFVKREELRARGGITGAQSGGLQGGGQRLVGEHGVEAIDLPAGSRVRSNADTRRMLNRGGGPTEVVLTVQVPAGASKFETLFIEMIRKFVRVRGGQSPDSVQRALGMRV